MLLDKQRIKEDLGLTDATKFCGFVIHIPKNDEFIGKIQEAPYSKVIGYVPIPDYALKFSSYEKAVKTSKKCDKYINIIGYLFDLGKQHFVGFVKNPDKE
jgi:hypothetical protein